MHTVPLSRKDSMRLIGYDNAPPSYQLTEEQQNWFRKKEEQLKKEIEIEFCALRAIQRADDYEVTDVIRIYDQGTSFVEGGPNRHTTFEYIELVEPEDRDKVMAEQRSIPFTLRQGRTVSRVNPGMIQATGFMEDPSNNEHYNILGELDSGTIWSRYSLSNYKKFTAGSVRDERMRSTDTVLDLIVGPWLEMVSNAEMFKEHRDKRREAARAQFLEYAQRHASQRQGQLYQQIQQDEREIIQYEQAHTEMYERMQRRQREYDFLLEDSGLDETKMLEEYNLLAEHKRMERLEFSQQQGTLEMTTDELYMYSPDHKIRTPVGKFKIKLQMQNKRVQIMNMTNAAGGRQHPHVPEEGNPCWGSMDSSVAMMLRKQEILGFFQFCIEYLESYNPQDSWGRWAANWWIPQEEEKQQWLQDDGTWLTKPEIEALGKKGKKTAESPAGDSELTQAIESGAAAEAAAAATTR